ncbi:MAG TPA: bifunctional diguanylate cyclase/phosphodiesterase [Acidiferrobacteraceae bacterium]|nr:bifunctional diguanylate cyclase/phosphodiesterase [Acidiferrobacteraceae bacterium]HEX20455.1 bifunctional diguanylate cyclase/phosphodiesterase [Acidiferrobacteraceae bacterium]
MLRYFSLTTKMLVLTVTVGIVIWVVSDYFLTHSLEGIFNAKLAERFSRQAEDQRIRFDRYIKGHHQAVKLFTDTHYVKEYIQTTGWKNNRKLKIYNTPVPWLPRLSIIRNFIQPRCIMLLDPSGKVREGYCTQKIPPPDEVLRPGQTLLSLSHNQGFLTRINGAPYLIASHNVTDDRGKIEAILMIVSPLDEEFLMASQGPSLSESTIIALLTEEKPSILVSSNSSLIPAGVALDSLKDRYLTIGQGFFDYGASDMVIVLASFISTDEVKQLTQEVLDKDRQLRGITALVFILAFVLVMFFITRRIQHLTVRVSDFSRNKKHASSHKSKGDQLWLLEERFRDLTKAVETETAALEHQTLHDTLTGLPNRKLLTNRLQHEILRSERTVKPLVLIISDLDHFKEINDTLGHYIGDYVLQQAAERFLSVFRKTDTVARLGGDEFGVLLPETNIEQATALVQKVVNEFNQPFIVEGHNLSIGISMGICESPMHGDDVNILLQYADVAMYMAKRNNLGYEVYDPDKDTHSIGRLALMGDLREAIEEQSLELYYQPKVDIDTGKVFGVEALLRWQHPKQGFITPDVFIPLAVQTGLYKPLTSWVVKHAIEQCVEWRQQGIEMNISVNLSVQNLHDVMLMSQIGELLHQVKLPASMLTLEITESDIMTDPVRARETLNHLNEMGVLLSIDDFGTGYSSLSYLKQLPVSEIKIDRSFVMDMTSDENDAIIVRATIDLAHNLGLKIVAEGVKDQATWEILQVLGCDIGQGYFISKPVPPGIFTKWLRSGIWPHSILQVAK